MHCSASSGLKDRDAPLSQRCALSLFTSAGRRAHSQRVPDPCTTTPTSVAPPSTPTVATAGTVAPARDATRWATTTSAPPPASDDATRSMGRRWMHVRAAPTTKPPPTAPHHGADLPSTTASNSTPTASYATAPAAATPAPPTSTSPEPSAQSASPAPTSAATAARTSAPRMRGRRRRDEESERRARRRDRRAERPHEPLAAEEEEEREDGRARDRDRERPDVLGGVEVDDDVVDGRAVHEVRATESSAVPCPLSLSLSHRASTLLPCRQGPAFFLERIRSTRSPFPPPSPLSPRSPEDAIVAHDARPLALETSLPCSMVIKDVDDFDLMTSLASSSASSSASARRRLSRRPSLDGRRSRTRTTTSPSPTLKQALFYLAAALNRTASERTPTTCSR